MKNGSNFELFKQNLLEYEQNSLHDKFTKKVKPKFKKKLSTDE